MSKAILAVLSIALLAGAGCEKKPAKSGDTGAISALDRAGSENGPPDTTPLQGIDVSKLSKEKQDLFYKLVNSLSSPCGKAHSLRTSYTSDTEDSAGTLASDEALAALREKLAGGRA